MNIMLLLGGLFVNYH